MLAAQSIDHFNQTFQENLDAICKNYFQFLSFPSISAEKEHSKDLLACRQWLSSQLQEMGFTTEVWETGGVPTLYAAHLHAGKNKPTVLIYHHYDVQPVDPLDAWETPPFEPQLRDGQVYARGAQDNKGQCFYTLLAIKHLLQRDGKLPVNLKLCIEGEEEIGSGGLAKIAPEHADQLKADHLFVPDAGIPALETPAVTLGIRGIITMTVSLIGSSVDCHSGEHGGILYNPLRALVELLSKLHDENGRVTVPGFYDDIEELTADEKNGFDFTFDAEDYEKMFGAKPVGGEKGKSPLESAWIRPTLEINGLFGGYMGDGFKTVIPAKANAKISCRIVPGQKPEKIQAALNAFFHDNLAPGMQLIIDTQEHAGEGMRTPIRAKVVQAVSQAYEEVFQKPCKRILAGGSINIVKDLAAYCDGNVVMMGLGLPDDNIHAPNEHFGLDRIRLGHLLIARSLEILGGN